MLPDYSVADAEAKSSPLANGLRSVEWLEDPRQGLGQNTKAVIDDSLVMGLFQRSIGSQKDRGAKIPWRFKLPLIYPTIYAHPG